MRILFCVLVLILVTVQLSCPLKLKFLKVVKRFNSTTYDFYYSCNTCSYSLQWRVNNQSAGTHDIFSPVGDVSFSQDASGTKLRYFSVLLSSRPETNQQVSCLDAVLVVTRSSFEQLEVFCRGGTERKFHFSPIHVELVDRSIESGAVKLEYVLSWPGIIQSSSVLFTTHVLVCDASGTQGWRINGLSAGGFNDPNVIGDTASQIYDSHPLTLYRETILMKKIFFNLTALLIVSTMNTSSNLSVTCRGLENFIEINIPVNLETPGYQATETTDSTRSPLGFTMSNVSSSIGEQP